MSGDTDIRNILQREFWDWFHGGVRLPARPDEEMPFERCMARERAVHGVWSDSLF